MKFNYLYLLSELVKSDVKTKYKNTFLGLLWVVFEPFFIMLILYLVFNRFIRFQMDYYPLYLLSGITAWRFFVNSTSGGMFAFQRNREMVLKVRLPRLLLPLSVVASNLYITFFEFCIYFIFFIVFTHRFSPIMLLIFPFLLIYSVFVFGVTVMLSLVYVFFRDIKPGWDILIQGLFFLCPIFYPMDIIPYKYITFYLVNPVAVFIMGFQDILYLNRMPDLTIIINSSFYAVLMLVLAGASFSILENRMVKRL